MNHERFDDLLLLYMTRSIDEADRAALLLHLETCGDCRAALADWQQIAVAVRLNAQEKRTMTASSYARPVASGANRRLLPLIAVTCALCIGLIALFYRPPSLVPLVAQIATPVRQVGIVLAARDIESGAVVSQDDLVLYQMPIEFAPFNALVAPEDAVGKIARTNIQCGLPVLANLLVGNAHDVPPQPGISQPGTCRLAPLTEPVETENIVMAVQEMDAGTPITAAAIALRPYPAQLVPDGAFTALADVLGRVTTAPLYREQLLTPALFSADPTHYVEVVIPAELIQNPDSVLSVGAQIDIIATVMYVEVDPTYQAPAGATSVVIPPGTGHPVTQRLVSGAEVATLFTDPSGALTSLTVTVLPDAAEVLHWMIEAKVPLTLALSPQ